MSKCPNCGTKIKVVLYPVEKQTKTKYNTFENVASTGSWWLPQLAYFMKGNKYTPPTIARTIRVISEIKTSSKQMLINQYDIPISEAQAVELADLYINTPLTWSRGNTVNQTSMTQPTHNAITKAFIGLAFLNTANPNKYQLTEAGLRFLRHYTNG